MLKIITLLTDFGLRDGYHGVLKGVIWGILPDAQIADISHEIAHQDVFEGAQVLARSAFFFPPGTVHVGVVDPGVGTQRRPIALRLGEYTFVGPDNGLFTRVLEKAESQGWPVEYVHLNRPRYWLPEVCNVFHGRDIFAPVAAHLASGVPLRDLGSPISDPVRLDIPRPARTPQGWSGRVVWVDIFGNLTTNLSKNDLAGSTVEKICIGGKEIYGTVRAFGDRAPGELVALIDSNDQLSVCMVGGSAARLLGGTIGMELQVVAARRG